MKISAPVAVKTCRVGEGEFGPFKDSCYVVPPKTMQFQQADFYCRKVYGGRLASLTDSKELEFAIQGIKDHG